MLLWVFDVHVVFGNLLGGSGFFVSCKMDADGHDGLETVGSCHRWDLWPLAFAGWIEHEHAESDEGVAEEDGDGEEDHYEEDVDFLAEVAICQGDCEV